MAVSLDRALQFQQTALHLQEARQELIASNIANADTPGFLAKDIDFSQALQNAVAGRAQPLTMAATAAQHLQATAGETAGGAPVLYRSTVQPSADGNTVSMDIERSQFAQNTLRYESSLKFAGQQIKDILSAIQG